MMRTQIQLSAVDHRRLKAWAAERGVSLSEAVRRFVAGGLSRQSAGGDREARTRAALAVCGKYREASRVSRTAEDHDRHLADAFGA